MKVWLCEMTSAAGLTAHKWLCRKHGLARRQERDDLGRLVWSKVVAERVKSLLEKGFLTAAG